MTNAISRVADDSPEDRSTVLAIALRQLQPSPASIDGRKDLLRQLPTEIRLMIFEELLVVPKAVVRCTEDDPMRFIRELNRDVEKGASEDLQKYAGKVQLSWHILLTCRQYFEEAIPILYGKNKFVFCPGRNGTPSIFWRFPVSRRYMPFLTDVHICFTSDEPWSETSRRVGHFLGALGRHAGKLENLTVVMSSHLWHCGGPYPWFILSPVHPVAKQLVNLVEQKPAKRLTIHLHQGALLPPRFAQFLSQRFGETGRSADRTLVFARSCACRWDPFWGWCAHPTCESLLWRPKSPAKMPWGVPKGVEVVVDTHQIEATVEEFIELQRDLTDKGVFWDDKADITDDGNDYVEFWPFVHTSRKIRHEARPAFETASGFVGYTSTYDLSVYRQYARGDRRTSGKKRQTKLDEFFPKVECVVDMGKADTYDLLVYLQGVCFEDENLLWKEQTTLEEFFPKAGHAVDGERML